MLCTQKQKLKELDAISTNDETSNSDSSSPEEIESKFDHFFSL